MSEITAGQFCWNELITSDTEGAKNFYTELFGWKSEEMDMGEMVYTMFRDANGPEGPEGMVAGMMKSPMPEIPSHWLSYVLVDDVEAKLEKAKSLGATVIRETTEIPMGTFAIFSDPQGAVFAIWKKKPCGDSE
ncbi:MAG: putative enzyme related to lactoylglutathione lyase [Verrucomicrobiales bacterium]|jgi:predicted enzyme related to lactoylglutathione lyase